MLDEMTQQNPSKFAIFLSREGVRNLILGYPTLMNKQFWNFFGEIHSVNPKILGYPRIPGSPLTPSLDT